MRPAREPFQNLKGEKISSHARGTAMWVKVANNKRRFGRTKRGNKLLRQ